MTVEASDVGEREGVKCRFDCGGSSPYRGIGVARSLVAEEIFY